MWKQVEASLPITIGLHQDLILGPSLIALINIGLHQGSILSTYISTGYGFKNMSFGIWIL